MRSLVFIFFILPISLLAEEIEMPDSIYVSMENKDYRSYKYNFDPEHNILEEIKYDSRFFDDKFRNDSSKSIYYFLNHNETEIIHWGFVDQKFVETKKEEIFNENIENGTKTSFITYDAFPNKWMKNSKREEIKTVDHAGIKTSESSTYVWDESQSKDWKKEYRLLQKWDENGNLIKEEFYSVFMDNWSLAWGYNYFYQYDNYARVIFKKLNYKSFIESYTEIDSMFYSDDYARDTCIKYRDYLLKSRTINFYSNQIKDSSFVYSRTDSEWVPYKKYIFLYDEFGNLFEEREFIFKLSSYRLVQSKFRYFDNNNRIVKEGFSNYEYKLSEYLYYKYLGDNLSNVLFERHIDGKKQLAEYEDFVAIASPFNDLAISSFQEIDISWGRITKIINEKEKKLNSVYPNPAEDYVIIKYKNESMSNVTLVIYELNGKIKSIKKQFQSENNNMFRIETSNYDTGTYYFNIFTTNNVISGSFIVQ